MKYILLICLLVVGLAACTGSGRKGLESIGQEACKKASSCCHSFRVARHASTPLDAEAGTQGNEETAIFPASFMEWRPEMLTW